MPRIEDLQLVVFGEVLKNHLNSNDSLVQDFIDTYGTNLMPVAEVRVMSPGSMSLIYGGNTVYPILALWRATNEYYSFTNRERRNTATVGIKYVLPADRETETAFAVLNRISHTIDTVQYYAQEGPLGGDIMKAAGIHSWGYRWNGNNGYEGPNEQTIYPTFNGTITLDMDENFDSLGLKDLLADWVGLDISITVQGYEVVSQSLPQPLPQYIPR